MYMRKSKLLALSAAMIVTSATAYGVYAADSARSGKASIEWTLSFIKKQENQRIDDVEEEINKVNKDTSITKFNMTKAKSRFDDVVFLGDSITEYLKQANILGPTSVLASKGEHVNQASKHLNEIKNLKPKQIVILYGANDLNTQTPEAFKENYISLVKKIKKLDPGVKVYLQAPLPVNETITRAKDDRINNENVKILIQKTKAVASATGANYLPSDGLITSKNLYEPDGIHLKYDFYKNWLYFLSENI